MQDIVKARRALEALGRRAQTVELAARTGIHQSQVSRLLRGQFRRVSPNVEKLLACAAQPARRTPDTQPQTKAKQAVIRAALRTWDATPEGARALVRLLRSVEGLRKAP
ncbi:MAG: hypothetical protein K0R40_3504 [Burkholderiales bacterium]|nr:hypothetical protein [Burkholderiales bacterium]